jgi:type IV pilus assembly protein PilC
VKKIRVEGIAVKARPAKRLSRFDRFARFFQSNPPTRSVCISLQQMAVMIENGIPIAQVLDSVSEQQDHPVLVEALIDIHDQIIFKGMSFSKALSLYPDIFPNFAVIFVRVGETSGDLAGRLKRSAELMERHSNLNLQMRSAVTSPLMTLGFSFLVVFAICKTIMPKFAEMYAQMKIELPVITQWVIFGVAVINHPLFWITGLVLISCSLYFRVPIRHKLTRWALQIPKVKYWFGTVLCTEFCDILSSMLSEGVPLHRSLTIIASCAADPYHKEHLQRAADRLREDGDLLISLRIIHYFPPLFLQLVGIGDEMGSLDKLLDNLRSVFEQQTATVTESMVKLLEPITMAITGVVMGVLFVGLFLPVYSILSKLGL